MKYIIVDDEPLAREGIREYAGQIPELVHLDSFNNAFSAARYLREKEADLVFLDINMPGMDGLELARAISSETLIIFTTAYSEYALESYELDAIDYLVKPIVRDRFHKAVQKALSYAELLGKNKEQPAGIEQVATDFVYIKADRKYFRIALEDILYIEGLKDYVVLHTLERKLVTALNIKTIYQQLPPAVFARISKSCVVNVKHIHSFDAHYVTIGDAVLSIGQAYRDSFFGGHVSGFLLSR